LNQLRKRTTKEIGAVAHGVGRREERQSSDQTDLEAPTGKLERITRRMTTS